MIGLKYSGASLTRLREYRRLLGPGFSLFNGNDSLALPALHEGADGLVSGNASARPELLVALYAAFRATARLLRGVPGGNLMTPPQLPRDTPVLYIVEPLVIGIDPVFREELNLA